MLIVYLWIYGGIALATLVCAAACRWGGPAERLCATTLWLAWIASYFVQSWAGKGPGDLVILIDTICLVVFVLLSLKFKRLWTLVVAASQLDDVMSHLASKLTHYVYSYVVVSGVFGGYFILLVLAIATIGHQRRLKRQARQEAALKAA